MSCHRMRFKAGGAVLNSEKKVNTVMTTASRRLLLCKDMALSAFLYSTGLDSMQGNALNKFCYYCQSLARNCLPTFNADRTISANQSAQSVRFKWSIPLVNSNRFSSETGIIINLLYITAN